MTALTLYHEYRIATAMHAIYLDRGADREALKKAATDCAGWYDTDVSTVVKVWMGAFPDDLRVETETIKEG